MRGKLFLSFVVCLVFKLTESDSRFGTFNFPELQHMKYEVHISPLPTSEREVSTQQGGHLMTSVVGQKYVCVMPPEKADRLAGAGIPNTTEMLLPLSETCLRKTMGWWTYEYCHGVSIKQLHLEAGKVLKEVVIGYYSNQTEWNQDAIDARKQEFLRPLSNSVQTIRHFVSYTNGTVCETTGTNRTAEVQISCMLSSNSVVVDVAEVTTCKYVLHIATPHICSHPLFTPANPHTADVIRCSPVLSQEEFERFQLNKQLEEDQETAPTRPHRDTHSSGSHSPRDQRVREFVLQALSTLFSDFEGMFEEEGEVEEAALKTENGQESVAALPNSPSSAKTNTPHIPSSISSRFRTDDSVASAGGGTNAASSAGGGARDEGNTNTASSAGGGTRGEGNTNTASSAGGGTRGEGNTNAASSAGGGTKGEGNTNTASSVKTKATVEGATSHLKSGKAAKDSEDTQNIQEGEVKVKLYAINLENIDDLKKMNLEDLKEMELNVEDLKEMKLEDIDLDNLKEKANEQHLEEPQRDGVNEAQYDSFIESVSKALESIMQDEQNPKAKQKQEDLENGYRHMWATGRTEKKSKTQPK